MDKIAVLIPTDANISANSEHQFSIDINNTNFAHGDGAYRISFYAKNAIDGSYCYGYNIVLSAIESVFGGLTEEYWKIVNKLEEWDNEREKETENENNN